MGGRVPARAIYSAMPSERASSSGTSISILRSAVEKVLPCASVIRESVPPPPKLSCRRKLSAPMFGSSKRSTAPLQMARKWSLTRSPATSRASRGENSGRSAMSPTLAVSPLSPERACASLSSLIRITFIKRASDLYAGRRPAPVELVRVGRACAASSLDASPDECLPREGEPVESYHDERVRDLPFADERGDFRERREADDRLLRPAEHRLAPELDAAREERVNPVLLNRGVGPSLAEEEKLCGRVAGLFEQLAGRVSAGTAGAAPSRGAPPG